MKDGKILKKKSKETNEKAIESLNNAKIHIEGDYRLRAHGSINFVIDLLKG